MRHLSVTRDPKREGLRVLLIDETPADRALVAAAAGPNAAIAAASGGDVAVGAIPAPEALPDIVLIGRRAERPGALLRKLQAADPRLPVILLSDETRADLGAGRLDASAAPDDPRGLAATITAALAAASRARAVEIEAMRRREERARFVIMLTDSARGLERPDDIAELTMRQLRERLGADRCVYGDVDGDGRSFTYAAVAAAPGVKSIAGRFPLSEHMRTALLERGPFVVGDTEQLPVAEDRQVFATIGARAVLVSPLVKGGRLVSVAGVHMLSPRRWRDDEIELVDVVAERLWEAMELARVSRELRKREREYRDLFELSAVGVAQSDPESGRFVRANRRFCELTGYSEDELQHLTFTDITHPDDREANTQAIGRVLRGEADRWSIEKRYVRSDGSIVWAQVSGQAMLDASGKLYRVIANAVDITARKRAEAALIASRRQLQLVTDSAPVLIANCGTDYRYKFVNKTYADRYGRTPQELIGQRVADVLGEAGFAQLKPHADRALAGESSDFEAEMGRNGTGPIWIRCAYAPELDESGKPVGWVGAIIDITDRKRAEQALREADRRKDEFLAVLGHELRNPLAPLRAGIELMREAADRPALLESLRAMMDRQLAHLIHLVDDLLDLARVTRGEIQLQRAPLDLADVIQAAAELSAPVISERRHSLEVAIEPTKLPVDGDFQRLTQVIGNLLSNAAKYTEPGGRIEVRATAENGRAVVRVKDTGYGIPADRLDYVFEMFGQVPEHREKTGGGGIGIGLALSRQLVTLHGGSIEAHSEGLGRGSEFVVTLPLAEPTAREARRPTFAKHRPSARRVLIVDDNVDAAEALRMVLELEGHHVKAAYSASEGLEAFDRFEPDVVLLDIGLPETDGYEVARCLRARPRGRDVVLYALTGWAQEEDRQRAFEAGFDEHLTKPVDMETLRRLITDGRDERASGGRG